MNIVSIFVFYYYHFSYELFMSLLIFLVGFVFFLFLKKIYLFFLAALGLCCCTQTFQSYSLAAGLRLLSRWQLLLLRSAGSRAFRGAHRLICMWDLLGPGIETVSPALAGRFLTNRPPEKPNIFLLKLNVIFTKHR